MRYKLHYKKNVILVTQVVPMRYVLHYKMYVILVTHAVIGRLVQVDTNVYILPNLLHCVCIAFDQKFYTKEKMGSSMA